MNRPDRRPLNLALLGAGALLLAYCYRPLLSLGTRYGALDYEVEAWLMTPNDRAPLIVLVLAGWLAWRRWPRLRELTPRRGPIGLAGAAFALALLIAVWAVHARADDLLGLSLIATLAGLILLQWGGAGVRVLWVPLAFLLFTIPMPGPLLVNVLWQLRLATADYTGWLLYVLQLPAFVSGDQIVRATQTFQVIEGCSGLRSMETLTMLVILLVDLFQRRGVHAAVLLVAAPIVAFAMNGLRVLTLILNPHSEVVAIHSLQGIAILLAGLLLVYGLDSLIARLRPARDAPRADVAKSPGATAPLGAVATLCVGTSLAIVSVATPVAEYPPIPTIDLEAIVDGSMDDQVPYEERSEDSYFYGRVRFRHALHREYRAGVAPLEVFLATGDRRDRRTSILAPITRVPSSGWRVRESRVVELPQGPVEMNLIERGIERRLSARAYEGRRPLAIETLRSLLAIDRSPYGDDRPLAVLRVSTPVGASSLEGAEGSPAEKRVQAALAALAERLRSRMGDSPSDDGAGS